MLLLVMLLSIKLLSQVNIFKNIWEKVLSNSRFIDIFSFTCNLDVALANEVENVINDEDCTFLDSALANKEIINSANDKNNDVDNFLSNIMINTEYFFIHWHSVQIASILYLIV